MMRYPRIAILMACHNRRNTTLDCLERIFAQKGISGMHLEVFLVDDGSSDGTGGAVRQKFPQVTVLEGDGSLYWVGGMRLAFGTALKKKFDFYLWLNDDTRLYDTALKHMLDTFFNLTETSGNPAIVVGSVCDEESGRLLYGGFSLRNWWPPLDYVLIEPSEMPQGCKFFNGNCAMIPREIANTIGNISPGYRHSIGDFDYAVKTEKAGFSSWIAPGYVGTCSANRAIERWKRTDLSMQERINALNNPVIVARVMDWVSFAEKNYKLLWPYFYIACFLRLRLPRLYIVLKTAFN